LSIKKILNRSNSKRNYKRQKQVFRSYQKVQKILINEISKRDNQQKYVLSIQVYETTQYQNAIINQECQQELNDKI